jgi:hypothetical protein
LAAALPLAAEALPCTEALMSAALPLAAPAAASAPPMICAYVDLVLSAALVASSEALAAAESLAAVALPLADWDSSAALLAALSLAAVARPDGSDLARPLAKGIEVEREGGVSPLVSEPYMVPEPVSDGPPVLAIVWGTLPGRLVVATVVEGMLVAT